MKANSQKQRCHALRYEKFNVNNFNQRMHEQRMRFAFDFYPNLH